MGAASSQLVTRAPFCRSCEMATSGQALRGARVGRLYGRFVDFRRSDGPDGGLVAF